jgi:DNA-binding LytR/AlgR family response regulator
MRNTRILIAERDAVIAKQLQKILHRWGCGSVVQTTDPQQFRELFMQFQPDIALISLSSRQADTGVAIARFISKQSPAKPFIYLIDQPDRHQIEKAKSTLPSGFLYKPIDTELLYANISLALHRHHILQRSLQPPDKAKPRNFQVGPSDNILYLEADHVYVRVYTMNGNCVLHRRSLSDMLKQLPGHRFIQTHRSYAVNIEQLSHWDKQFVYVRNRAVPMSRSRRKAVMAALGKTSSSPSVMGNS